MAHGDAKRYTLTAGRFARMESGVRKEYRAGDTILLTEVEAKRLSAIVAELDNPPSLVAVEAPLRISIPEETTKSTAPVEHRYGRGRKYRKSYSSHEEPEESVEVPVEEVLDTPSRDEEL